MTIPYFALILEITPLKLVLTAEYVYDSRSESTPLPILSNLTIDYLRLGDVVPLDRATTARPSLKALKSNLNT